VSLHILVPGVWTIQQGHALAEQIERDIITTLPKTTVFTHLEPVEDPVSWEDQTLDRPADQGQVRRQELPFGRHRKPDL
jgi:divalent metal cation (Fe/Co/Zn/Cd) transporter